MHFRTWSILEPTWPRFRADKVASYIFKWFSGGFSKACFWITRSHNSHRNKLLKVLSPWLTKNTKYFLQTLLGMIHTFPIRFRYISNNPAATFLEVVKCFILSTYTGQHTKNPHRLTTLHFLFCVADKPSYPYAGLAECARRVSIIIIIIIN